MQIRPCIRLGRLFRHERALADQRSSGLHWQICRGSYFSSDPKATVLGVGRSAELPGFFSHLVTGKNGPIRAPLPAYVHAQFDNRYTYVQSDVCDASAIHSVVQARRPNHILHLASGLRGDRSEDLLQANIQGTEALMRAVLDSADERLIFVLGSSGGVYGALSMEEPAPREHRYCSPENAYTAAKLAAEQTAQSLAGTHDIRLIVARIFNVIGAGQDERHVAGRLALQIVRILDQGPRELCVGRVDPTPGLRRRDRRGRGHSGARALLHRIRAFQHRKRNGGDDSRTV